MSLMQLYRASDRLVRRQSEIEEALFSRIQNLFSPPDTVTLYDLTNTFFEGKTADNGKARYGRSKEKRSDCPLLTLGLVLDGSGFALRSKVFAGNVAEGTTLDTMLGELEAPSVTLVIMDQVSPPKSKRNNVGWALNKGRFLNEVVHLGQDKEAPASLRSGGGQLPRNGWTN